MGVIWTNKTRTKQPQEEVGVNWGNPLTRGLRILDHGMLNNRKPDPRLQTVNYDSAAQAPTYLGVARRGTFGKQHAVFDLSVTNAVTYFSVGRFVSTEANNCSLVLKAGGSNGDSGLMVHGGSDKFRKFLIAGNTTSWQLAYTVSANSIYQFAAQAVTADSAGNCVAYLNGAVVGTSTITGGLVARTDVNFTTIGGGYNDTGSLYVDVDLLIGGVFDRALSAAEIASISANPWQLFAPERRPIFYSLSDGGSNNTATLSSTLDAATLTGVGAVTRSGTLAVTLDAATLAGIGGAARSGTLAVTLGDVTLAGVGTAAVTNKTGTLAVTLDAATLTGVGAVTTSGTLSSTLEDATLAGVGSVAVGSNRDGTLAATLDAATLAGIGAVTTSGTLAVTLDNVTLAGIGSVGQPRTGTLSVTLDNVTLRGIGAIPAAPSTGGGKGHGSNLSRKQKKKLKAVESQEWLKAEETARQLLNDRFTKQTPQEKAQALETYIESLQPVIEALKALTSQIEEVVEEAPVIELTPHQEVIQRFDRLEKKVKSVEELIIILMADL